MSPICLGLLVHNGFHFGCLPSNAIDIHWCRIAGYASWVLIRNNPAACNDFADGLA